MYFLKLIFPCEFDHVCTHVYQFALAWKLVPSCAPWQFVHVNVLAHTFVPMCVTICKFPHAYQFVPSCGNATTRNCVWQFIAMKIEFFCHNYHKGWKISIQRDFQMTNMNDDKSKFNFNIEHKNQDKNIEYVKCRFKWKFMSRIRQKYNLKKIIWIQQQTIIKWFYCLNNAWCKLNMRSWIKNT